MPTDRLLQAVERDERAVLFTPSSRAKAAGRMLSCWRAASATATACRRKRSSRRTSSSVSTQPRSSSSRTARVFAEVYGPPPRLLIYGAVDTSRGLVRRGEAPRLAHDRGRRAREVRHAGAAAERRRDRRRVAGGGSGPHRARPRDGRRRADARRQVRRARAQGGARVARRSTSARSARAGTRSAGGSGSSRRVSTRRRSSVSQGRAASTSAPSRSPETALSILAEVLAVRMGRDGGKLKESKQRIHAEEVAAMTDRVEKTDAEWQSELDPDRYQVLRCGATEAPWSGELNLVHDDGVFRCGACGAELFRSDTKFDSGSGWPSFFAPLAEDAVETEEDLSHGMRRTEVRCAPATPTSATSSPTARSRPGCATASTRWRWTSSPQRNNQLRRGGANCPPAPSPSSSPTSTGSTRLLHELGARGLRRGARRHRRVIREACAGHDGARWTRRGDAFFLAFPRLQARSRRREEMNAESSLPARSTYGSACIRARRC